MKKREIFLTDLALITCIVQRGLGDEIVIAAREAGALGATINYARGTGVRERLGILGVAVEVEKEVLVGHSMIGLLLHQLAKMVIMLAEAEELMNPANIRA